MFCLTTNHNYTRCPERSKVQCRQCNKHHHPVLGCGQQWQPTGPNPRQTPKTNSNTNLDRSNLHSKSETAESSRITVTMNNIHPSHRHSPSYSRTCPVELTHPSTRESITGLVIIDDQSAMTFVDPLINQALKLPQEVMLPSTQATLTIQGESEAKPCHIIEGLVVTPLDGQLNITLLPVIMQNKIGQCWAINCDL